MRLTDTIGSMFAQLTHVLQTITDANYITPVDSMSGATIGEHTRHVIEFYTELSNGYENGLINYDQRQRNHRIQTDRQFAIEKINAISIGLDRNDKDLMLRSNFGSHTQHAFTISTNYSRELIYNLEHTVHHMALIRVALNCLTKIDLPTEFGVAASTIQYREKCAQ